MYCHCTVFSFTHWATHSTVARSLFRPRYMFIANLQCTFQALQHFCFFSKFFPHRFHFETYNKKSKNSCWTWTWSGQCSIFVCFVPVNICFFCSILMVASPFFVSSWNSPAVVWAAPSFVLSENMSHSDNVQTIAAAATSQVKLCPYDEEEPAIWFRLIEAPFAIGGASNRRNSGTPMLWPACPSKSFGTF